MKREYYTSPKAGFLSKLLWKAAGADEYLLNKSTFSDHVKYATLGGIVCSTGFMAALAGGYAFYIVFREKASAISNGAVELSEQTMDIQTLIISIVFGMIWGLIIFNIDRFIVASTGKGDGTDAITWGEFRGAIPRIIMGIIIAITISKPVELRMFETEIDVELHKKQQKEYAESQANVEMNFRPRIEQLEAEMEELRVEISNKRIALDEANTLLTSEIDGRSGSGLSGDGPAAREKRLIRDLAQAEYERVLEKNEAEIDKKKMEKEAEEEKIKNEKAKSENVANGLNGLLERINILHEIASPAIIWFITLLFLAIELTPIFFKMMLIKSPYDFMNDNIKSLIKAEQGIEIKYDYFKDKEGVQRDLVINHQAEKMMREKIKLIQTQSDLNQLVLDQWKSKESQKIKKDPDDYIES
ncbi:DUF4407 domain-containing protein [Flavobacteriales bacterium]|nr:DUF4407 domain-containing protein [Flavobacteriales bacterium]